MQVEITTFDTTLRDGAQSLPQENQFPVGSKSEAADGIASLGVGVIEAGFPATPGDAEEVKEVAQKVGNRHYPVEVWSNKGHIGTVTPAPVIAGLSRTMPDDIEKSWEAVNVAQRPRIHTFISTDADHMMTKFPGKTPKEVLEMGRSAIKLAKQFTQEKAGATVEFSAEAASTTDPSYLERVVKMAADEGVDVINVPDTVGQRTPQWMKAFYAQVIQWAKTINPEVTISAHNHNDMGLAIANTFSLVEAAAEVAHNERSTVRIQAETTLCGLGERAGNADIFPFMANLFKFSGDLVADSSWAFNPHRSVPIASGVMALAGLEVPRQSPIIGRDTNVHRSGIHSDGIIKGGDEDGYRIYTPFDPTFWGHLRKAQHEEGRYQGRKGIAAARQAS